MMDRAHLIKSYLGEVSQIISELPADVIDDLVQTLKLAYNEGRCVMICGNGGSAATASHLACDLQKGVGCLKDQKFKAIAFTDAMPIITAWANDTDYDNIFAEQVVHGQPSILIAISGKVLTDPSSCRSESSWCDDDSLYYRGGSSRDGR